MPKRAILYTDGASFGNPGPAGIGVVLTDESGNVLERLSEPIGYATNNEAEYRALIRGLERAVALGVEELTWYADSELVVRQWTGQYRVKQPHLAQLLAQARALAQKIPRFVARHTLRGGNTEADALAKQGARMAEKQQTPNASSQNPQASARTSATPTPHQAVERYLHQIRTVAQSPHTTNELSYHGALQTLLQALLPQLQIVHEPTRTVAGRPDFVLLQNGMPVGYVEAEAYGADLDNLPPHARAQNEAFQQHLENFLLTSFLEFRLYRAGQEVMRARLPQPPPQGKISLPAQNTQELIDLLRAFGSHLPAPVADARTLAQHLAQRARLLKTIVEQSLHAQLKQPPDAPLELRNLYRALQSALLPDLAPSEFADLYAQTIAYGLFAARCYAPQARFTRHDAARVIPDTIPFLKRLLGTLTMHELEPELAWLMDDLASLLARADIHAILQDFGRREGREDPVVHFYEDFLTAYDPNQREVRGVYYTPEPVVQFIVRAVDAVLRHEFGFTQGLMEPNALILDPACGTGSFLYEIVHQVHAQVVRSLGAGQWADYAREQLAPRLFGFELLMAPYTIAHLKLTLELHHLGAPPTERLRIYLTNALDPAVKPAELLLGEFITREASEAAEVKRDKPILVVLGNPPYSGHSANRSVIEIREKVNGRTRTRKQLTWIGKLVEEYKQVNGQPLEEKNPKWLQDDYVKFLRFAEWRIQQTGQGVVAFITNHAYLDNPTFRGMRAHLLKNFQKLYIVNLHGNARRKERAPDGNPDENVFDIQQGVAILIAIRHPEAEPTDAPVRYYDVWGSREAKYQFLREATLDAIPWTPLTPRAPMYLFVPQDTAREEEYLQGWRIPDIFPVHSVGIVTARDSLTIHRTPDAVWKTVCELVKQDAKTARQMFRLGERTSDERIESLLKDLRDAGVPNESAKHYIVPILYRPFDIRYTFYTGVANGFHERPRPEVMRHLLTGKNQALITTRGQAQQEPYWSKVFVTSIPNEGHFATDIAYTFPLYLHETQQGGQSSLLPDAVRRVNLRKEFMEALSRVLGRSPAPEAVLGYLYAVLHSPAYRTRYAEFLKRDFPRVPLPPDATTFDALAQHGMALINLHLLRDPRLQEPLCKYPVEGDHRVERVEYDATPQRVWINASQYFEPVPPKVWAFRVGGYQVCEKWLQERKGTPLSLDERLTYQKMVTAIAHTLTAQQQIDTLVRQAWGW
ncbi:Predicted helicase [Armatimonadetes bacterium GXS]|jgi:ribonuclease HI|nr:Predicted helicase [Armatimonadetes bacterium GXS]